jgi:transposase
VGIAVIEVSQPDRATRRRLGKTDAIDAESAARAVLAGQATASAKAGDGPVEMIRMFKLAKASAIKARTQAINQLKAVLVGADPALREKLPGLSSTILIRRCAQLDARVSADGTSAATYTLRLLACRILSLASEVRELEQHIGAAVLAHTPQLMQQQGIGPDSAAALLITAGDNPGRLHSEASFAALCGVSPVEASSGRTSRRRLNRGRDRQANAALYRIALSRLRWDQPTRQYLDKRITGGKTKREAMRCLKRYIAREVYHLVTTPSPRLNRNLGLDIHRGIYAATSPITRQSGKSKIVLARYVHNDRAAAAVNRGSTDPHGHSCAVVRGRPRGQRILLRSRA